MPGTWVKETKIDLMMKWVMNIAVIAVGTPGRAIGGRQSAAPAKHQIRKCGSLTPSTPPPSPCNR